MAFGGQRKFGKKPPTASSQRADLLRFLVNARDLSGVTAEQLAHRHKVDLPVAKYELAMALQRRAGQ